MDKYNHPELERLRKQIANGIRVSNEESTRREKARQESASRESDSSNNAALMSIAMDAISSSTD